MTVRPAASLRFVDMPGRRTADPLSELEAASSLRVVHLQHVPERRAHRHPLTEEVYYVIAGQGTVWIDGVSSPLAVGDVVCIPRGAVHATVPSPGTSMELVCFFPHPKLEDNTEETEIIVNPSTGDDR